MSSEQDRNWPHRHKKELGLAAGGLFVFATGVLGVRGKLHLPDAEKRRHPNAHDIASVLVDEARGEDLFNINRMAALMSIIKKATRPEINELFGANGSEAGRYMAPLIAKRFVAFQRPSRSEQRLAEYVVNEDVLEDIVDIAAAEPERYATFLNQRAVWLDHLASGSSDSS